MVLTIRHAIMLQTGDISAEGMEDLITELVKNTYLPNRNPSGPFIFSVDHCFSLRGQGTVLTGTAINGSVAVNDVSDVFMQCVRIV